MVYGKYNACSVKVQRTVLQWLASCVNLTIGRKAWQHLRNGRIKAHTINQRGREEVLLACDYGPIKPPTFPNSWSIQPAVWALPVGRAQALGNQMKRRPEYRGRRMG